jgi:transcriptional regulator with XRE-family HTH domain
MWQQQQLSLRELATEVEISARMLGQIGTGRVYPFIRSTYNITAALAIAVDYFSPIN